jgi:hypothetical protein
MALHITREELEAELQRLGVGTTDDDETLKTSLEWAEAWNCDRRDAVELLNNAKRHGLLVVGRKVTTRLDDKPHLVGAYGFKNGKKKAKKGPSSAKT